MNKHLTYWVDVFLLALIYCIGAELGVVLFQTYQLGVVIWPPAGITIAFLFYRGYNRFPGIILGCFLVGQHLGYGFNTAIIDGIANTSLALIGYFVLKRFQFNPQFAQLRDAIYFLLAATLAPISCSLIGHLGFPVMRSETLLESLVIWWAGDVISILIITTFIFAWFTKLKYPLPAFTGLDYMAAFITVFTMLLQIAYGYRDLFSIHLFFLIEFPLIMWATYNFRQRGATMIGLLLSLSTIIGMYQVVSASEGDITRMEVITMWIYSGALLSTALMLACLLNERSEKEATLMETNQRFENLFENAADAIFVHDAEGRIHNTNQQALQSLGMTRDQMLQSRVWDFNPTTTQHTAPSYWNSLPQNEPTQLETIHEHISGERFPVEIKVSRFAQNDEEQFLAIVRDITERKESERKLELSRSFLQNILDSLPSQIAVLNKDGIITSVNKAWIEFANENDNLDRTYGVGSNYLEICESVEHETEGSSQLANGIRDVLTSQIDQYRMEYDCSSPWERRWYQVQVTQFFNYDEPQAIVVHNNISPIKTAQENLRKRLRFETCLARVSQSFLAHTEIQQAFEDALVYLHQATEASCAFLCEVKLNSHSGLMARSSAKSCMFKKSCENNPCVLNCWCGEFSEFTEEIKSWETSLRNFEIVSESISSAEENVRKFLKKRNLKSIVLVPIASEESLFGFLGFEYSNEEYLWPEEDQTIIKMAADVIGNYVQRKKSEHEKEMLQEQLQQSQKMEAIGNLAGGVAHDFNNILTAIVGNLSLAQLKGGDDISPYITNAEKAAERACNLVRDLLSFSRKSTFTLKAVQVNDIADELVRLMRQTIDRQIDLTLDLDQNLPEVYADANQIHTVLMNLIVNARDAIEEQLIRHPASVQSPRISIQSRVETLTPEQCKPNVMAHPGTYICIEISDNGSGIPAEILAHVFEPFYTTKMQGKGTGLGLASALGIIQQHQGWMDVTSKMDEGTTFRIYLPPHNTENVTIVDEHKSMSTQSLETKETILAIEDEVFIRELYQNTLGVRGFDIHFATDGQEGVERYLEMKGSIDLIILDLSLPRLSGHEVLQRICMEEERPNILVCSGYSDRKLTYPTETANIQTLHKPFKPGELIDHVSAMIAENIVDHAVAETIERPAQA